MMKTHVLKTTVFVLALVIITSGCTKTEETKNADFIAQSGILHNQLLDHYYEHRTNQSPDTKELISEVIALSSDYLISKGYAREVVLEAESRLNDEYSASHLKSLMNSDFSIDIESLASQLEGMELYSDRFIDDVSELLVHVSEENEINRSISFLNAEFAGKNYENVYDREGQMLFVNILNSSYEYWTNSKNSALKGLALDDQSKVIINDGIGGLIGLIFGPAGSIITATVFSVGTSRELNS